MIMVMALALAASAQAQTALNYKTFSVPFSFKVGKQVLPAGEYKVTADNQVIRVKELTERQMRLHFRSARAAPAIPSMTRSLRFDVMAISITSLRFGCRITSVANCRESERENTDLAKDFSIVDIPSYQSLIDLLKKVIPLAFGASGLFLIC